MSYVYFRFLCLLPCKARTPAEMAVRIFSLFVSLFSRSDSSRKTWSLPRPTMTTTSGSVSGVDKIRAEPSFKVGPELDCFADRVKRLGLVIVKP